MKLYKDWIPACAGMTERSTGMTRDGSGMTERGAGMTRGGSGMIEKGMGMAENEKD